jgi:hypothetical protein
MVRIGILLILLGCSTDNNNLQSPPDTKKAILELNEIQVQPKDQIKKERIIKTLEDCTSYGNLAYEKYNQCVEDSKVLTDRISSLELELKSIEEEIQPWRWIKRGFVFALLGFMIFYFIRFYLKYKPI